MDAPITQSDAIMAFRSYEEALVGLSAEIFYELEMDGIIGVEAKKLADAAVSHVGEGGQRDRIPEGCLCDAASLAECVCNFPSQASRLRIARLV